MGAVRTDLGGASEKAGHATQRKTSARDMLAVVRFVTFDRCDELTDWLDALAADGKACEALACEPLVCELLCDVLARATVARDRFIRRSNAPAAVSVAVIRDELARDSLACLVLVDVAAGATMRTA